MKAALSDAQQPLADELDRWERDPRSRFAIRSRIQCVTCGEELGRLVDVALDLGEPVTLTLATFSPVLSIKVYARDRVTEIRQARDAGEDPVPGQRYPYDDYVVAFPQQTGTPSTFALHCTKHGDRMLDAVLVLRGLEASRRTDEVRRIRV